MSNSEIKSLRTEAIAATVALPEDKEVCEIHDHDVERACHSSHESVQCCLCHNYERVPRSEEESASEAANEAGPSMKLATDNAEQDASKGQKKASCHASDCVNLVRFSLVVTCNRIV
jgi:hypothetical protein